MKVNELLQEHLKEIPNVNAERKMLKFGSVLILPENRNKFQQHLDLKGIPHKADFVPQIEVYLFQREDEEA